MARHAAPPPPRRRTVERAFAYGLAPAIALGGVFAPAAAAAVVPADETHDPGSSAGVLPGGAAAADLDEATTAPPTVAEYGLVVAGVEPGTGPSAEAAPSAEAEADAQVEPGETVVLDAAGEETQATGPVIESEGFQTVGVTWPIEAGSEVPELQARVRGTDGDWSEWHHLEVAVDEPDEATRGGTESLYVGQAEAVQLATVDAAEALPDGAQLALVSSPEVTDPAAQAAGAVPAAETTAAAETMAATVTPTVITRAQWGANAPTCSWDSARTLVGAAIHHTVNSNSYATRAEAMQLLRNDQAYHQQTRGWCDIGYNFLVDKWGNIYEGAAGSLSSALIGAHASGFNTGTVGVALLGDHGSVGPSEQTLRSAANIATYRLAQYGVSPTDRMEYTSRGGTSKFPAGTVVNLPRIFGHRDTGNTACPGQLAYDQLGTLRIMAGQWASNEYAQLLREAPLSPATIHKRNLSVVKALYQDLFGRDADASGLAKWTAVLDDGSSIAALTGRLTSSSEYRTLRISRAYQDILGRPVDEAGLQSRLAGVSSGAMSIDYVPIVLLGSWEYFRTSGGSDATFVAAAYQDALGRPASATEVAVWVDRVPALGREGVARRIWGSAEGRRVRVDGYYRLFFGRAVDAGGAEKWVELMGTRGEGFVRAALTGSKEYRERAVNRFPS